MRTFLFYTSPARGHLYPMMDIVLELKSRGHRVVVQTLASEAPHLEKANVEHRPIHPTIEELELHDYEGSNPMAQIQLTFKTWVERAPFEVDDLRASIDEIAPDYLIIDANTFGAPAVAQASGIPWALHMPYCLPTASDDAPAFGPGFTPPQGPMGRLRDRMVRGMLPMAVGKYLKRLTPLREAQGLPPLKDPEQYYAEAPLILYRTAEPFEYPRSDWAKNVLQLGPGLWAPSGVCPEWVDELPRPRVLVSISTEAQKDGAIIQTAIEALGGEPMSVICTTGAESPDSFQNLASNIRVEPFLPHAELVDKLDLVVTHGGMGTVQRGLAAGVPLVVVPWGRDQNETARRTVVANAGTTVAPNRLNAKSLREAVAQALTKTEGAARVAKGFRTAGGASEAADVLEKPNELTAVYQAGA